MYFLRIRALSYINTGQLSAPVNVAPLQISSPIHSPNHNLSTDSCPRWHVPSDAESGLELIGVTCHISLGSISMSPAFLGLTTLAFLKTKVPFWKQKVHIWLCLLVSSQLHRLCILGQNTTWLTASPSRGITQPPSP